MEAYDEHSNEATGPAGDLNDDDEDNWLSEDERIEEFASYVEGPESIIWPSEAATERLRDQEHKLHARRAGVLPRLLAAEHDLSDSDGDLPDIDPAPGGPTTSAAATPQVGDVEGPDSDRWPATAATGRPRGLEHAQRAGTLPQMLAEKRSSSDLDEELLVLSPVPDSLTNGAAAISQEEPPQGFSSGVWILQRSEFNRLVMPMMRNEPQPWTEYPADDSRPQDNRPLGDLIVEVNNLLLPFTISPAVVRNVLSQSLLDHIRENTPAYLFPSIIQGERRPNEVVSSKDLDHPVFNDQHAVILRFGISTTAGGMVMAQAPFFVDPKEGATSHLGMATLQAWGWTVGRPCQTCATGGDSPSSSKPVSPTGATYL